MLTSRRKSVRTTAAGPNRISGPESPEEVRCDEFDNTSYDDRIILVGIHRVVIDACQPLRE
jgi:hypothetical protein